MIISIGKYLKISHNSISRKVSCVAKIALAVGVIVAGCCFSAEAKSSKKTSDYVVVIDPGHGGKDHGAIDNNAREKDINLAVAKRLGELIEKKLKNTDVVFTREDDTFVSLQGRADIANKAKGNLFISIHTNSVDAKNKNRTTVAGASVYTLGNHKDDANMSIARRENAVIELENGYQQKYSGFDPNKDESYIIFEMAQKQNIAQSNRFAKMVQDNLVKIAGRKDRGVHQAGFWVLWSTSMPSVLVELDFICNPESAKFMTSDEGVDKLAEAIFQAVKVAEQNYLQSKKMAQENVRKNPSQDAKSVLDSENEKILKANAGSQINTVEAVPAEQYVTADASAELKAGDTIGLAFRPESVDKDLSHAALETTRSQKRARHTADGRRRRSQKAKEISESRNVEGTISLLREYTGKTERVEPVRVVAAKETPSEVNPKDKKNKKKSGKKVSTKKLPSKEVVAETKETDNFSNTVAKEVKSKTSDKKDDKKAKEKELAEKREIARRNAAQKERAMKDAAKKAESKKAEVKEVAVGRESDPAEVRAGERKSLRARTQKNVK